MEREKCMTVSRRTNDTVSRVGTKQVRASET